MKYRDVEIGSRVRLRNQWWHSRWGDCLVVQKAGHGILTLQEDRGDRIKRHYVNVGRVALAEVT